MSMSKKLYLNFGFILAMVLVLFLVTWFAVQREQAAKSAADNTGKIRFQIMQNRLYLSNYLLSGDSREVEHMNDGIHLLDDYLQAGEKLASSAQQRAALEEVHKNEAAWQTEF